VDAVDGHNHANALHDSAATNTTGGVITEALDAIVSDVLVANVIGAEPVDPVVERNDNKVMDGSAPEDAANRVDAANETKRMQHTHYTGH
jgi:hypothetical protein